MSSRTIIISGGSRGLGLELVRHFLARGDSVATFSRSRTDAVAQLLEDRTVGQRFFHQSADAADSQAVAPFVQAVHRRFGRIDGLVNNAGIAREGVLAMASDQAIRELLDVNLLGALLLTRECVRLMLLACPQVTAGDVGAVPADRQQGRGDGGRIVNVSSIVGLRGYAGLSVYAATKAALIGLTISLARELGPRNITVNAVAPGYLETEMTGELSDEQKGQIVRRTPLGRLGRPADVVGCVEFLMSPAAGFITGQTLLVDGGISC